MLVSGERSWGAEGQVGQRAEPYDDCGELHGWRAFDGVWSCGTSTLVYQRRPVRASGDIDR
jgi:hypothetical protein